MEILTPYLKDIDQNFRFRLLDALVGKTNRENIKWIDKLMYKNIGSIHRSNLNAYLNRSFSLKLMNSKSSLKYLKYSRILDKQMIKKIKKIALLDFKGIIVNEKLNTGT